MKPIERNLVIPNVNMHKYQIIKKCVYQNIDYSDIKKFAIDKIVHGGCAACCDYFMLNHCDIIVNTDMGSTSIIEKIKSTTDVIDGLYLSDFMVYKFGEFEVSSDKILIAGFKENVLVILTCDVSVVETTINVDNIKVITEIECTNSDDDPEISLGIQCVYNKIYIATNYRFVTITLSCDDLYSSADVVSKKYPVGMIRPNGMVKNGTEDIILYYNNGTIPMFYKYIGSNGEWHSFVDNMEYSIVDAIIFDGKLIVYGDDSNIHWVNDIHDTNPVMTDFVCNIGHQWIGNATCYNGNVFMQRVVVETLSNLSTVPNTIIDSMYSINGINFDSYHKMNLRSIGSGTNNFRPTAYVGHGSIILYGYGDLNEIQYINTGIDNDGNVDMCCFEQNLTYKNVNVVSIEQIENTTKYRIFTDLKMPINVRHVDATITTNTTQESKSSVSLIKYNDCIKYLDYGVNYIDGESKYTLTLVFDFGKNEIPDKNSIVIDVSYGLSI